MSSTATRPRRPVSVTLVMILMWLGAIATAASGIYLIVQAADPGVLADYGGNARIVRAVGIAQVLLGVVVALVAVGIGRGSEFARFLVTLVLILRIVADVFIAAQYGEAFVWQIVAAVLWSLFVLFLLWNSRAGGYFRPA
jgi:hypothetical protein